MIRHCTDIEPRARGRSGGYSLIELVVVLAVSSTLLVVAVGWIHQSMKFGALVRARQTHHQSLLRLASLLRGDVNRGQVMSIDGAGQLSITTDTSSRIRYTITPTALRRQIIEGDRVSSQDTFTVMPTTILLWEVGGMPETVGLIVERGNQLPRARVEAVTDAGSAPMIELHVRASVGRWSPATGVRP